MSDWVNNAPMSWPRPVTLPSCPICCLVGSEEAAPADFDGTAVDRPLAKSAAESGYRDLKRGCGLGFRNFRSQRPKSLVAVLCTAVPNLPTSLPTEPPALKKGGGAKLFGGFFMEPNRPTITPRAAVSRVDKTALGANWRPFMLLLGNDAASSDHTRIRGRDEGVERNLRVREPMRVVRTWG